MSHLEHAFTRDTLTYDCYARLIPFLDLPRPERRVWYVMVNGREYQCMRWQGTELSSTEARVAFETAIVATIADGRGVVIPAKNQRARRARF